MTTSELMKKQSMISDGVKYLKENYAKHALKIGDASSKCFISEAYFRKLFSQVYGVSPIKYLNKIRLKKAGELLEMGNYKVSEVFKMCGYVNACRFSREFKKYYKISPSNYKKQSFLEM